MLQCGLFRSNFSLAMGVSYLQLSRLVCPGLSASALLAATRAIYFGSGFRPGSGAAKVGAGEGNRTLVISLEGCCSTIELHPPGDPFRSCLLSSRLPALDGGGGWIRTNVGIANGFTVRPL